ncbi:MAG: 4Fe-4S dicluster domain-containing protein, partial [Thermoplasmata archaeon]
MQDTETKQARFFLSKDGFNEFVKNLIEKSGFTVVGVKAKQTYGNSKTVKYDFDNINNPSELVLDYDVTNLPPKKYFLPPCEKLMEWDRAKMSFTPAFSSEKIILIGVHPYDIEAINQIDMLFSTDCYDEHYDRRRKNIVIIGVNMTRASPRSFAYSMGTSTVSKGYDMMLTPIESGIIVETGTAAGEELLNKFSQPVVPDENQLKEYETVLSKIPELFKNSVSFDKNLLPEVMEKSYTSKVWEEMAKKCYSCGSCNLVCPTCYCFDVTDSADISLKTGSRERTWDGCLLEDFALVAGNENFRHDRFTRYRHRFYRKGSY